MKAKNDQVRNPSHPWCRRRLRRPADRRRDADDRRRPGRSAASDARAGRGLAEDTRRPAGDRPGLRLRQGHPPGWRLRVAGPGAVRGTPATPSPTSSRPPALSWSTRVRPPITLTLARNPEFAERGGPDNTLPMPGRPSCCRAPRPRRRLVRARAPALTTGRWLSRSERLRCSPASPSAASSTSSPRGCPSGGRSCTRAPPVAPARLRSPGTTTCRCSATPSSVGAAGLPDADQPDVSGRRAGDGGASRRVLRRLRPHAAHCCGGGVLRRARRRHRNGSHPPHRPQPRRPAGCSRGGRADDRGRAEPGMGDRGLGAAAVLLAARSPTRAEWAWATSSSPC